MQQISLVVNINYENGLLIRKQFAKAHTKFREIGPKCNFMTDRICTRNIMSASWHGGLRFEKRVFLLQNVNFYL